MPQTINNKTTIITGSASGIGRGIARLFHQQGGNVVISDINFENAQRVADQLGDRAIAIECDVTKEQDIIHCIEKTVAQYGQLNCIVNNAGTNGFMGPITETTEQDYRNSMDLLLLSVLMGMKHAIPYLRKTAGSIINISSTTGLRADSQSILYASAKAAVIHMTKCAAQQLGGDKIRVNCIAPGLIVTPIFQELVPGLDEDNPDHIDLMGNYFAEFQPLNTVGIPNDIAEAALYLASDSARYVTGQTLTIDGGATLSCSTESRNIQAKLQAGS